MKNSNNRPGKMSNDNETIFMFPHYLLETKQWRRQCNCCCCNFVYYWRWTFSK